MIEREISLVGSIPLANAAEVFECMVPLAERLRRVPDGETGPTRSIWILCQQNALTRSGGFDAADPSKQPEHKYSIKYPFELNSRGESPGFEIGAIDYAAWAIASYARFRTLKEAGAIPRHWRFQVCLPTPLVVINRLVVPSDQPVAYRLYHAAMRREIAQITTEIPNAELSIQIDIAPEFGFLEGIWSSEIASSKQRMISDIVELTAELPADVELGYHLCYGDFGHKHFVEPKDMAHLVDVANTLAAQSNHGIAWLHMPVPRDRSDREYFEPLRHLKIDRTTLFLGLIHLTDGTVGAARRIEAASQFRSDFGIATECGWGRRTPDQIEALIALHAMVKV